jgi:uncharacterized membrane-anchored protein YjiN (DUF445 family)
MAPQRSAGNMPRWPRGRRKSSVKVPEPDAEPSRMRKLPPAAASVVSADPDNRLRDLRKMRMVATALLVLMCAIFIATSLTRFDWPWLPYLQAFAEAGMIGACADWFAVVALFRHPLGLPIPHTAIVPNNKDRIGAALGRFVSNNFLSPAVLTAKIREIDSAGWIARRLSNPATARGIARRAVTALPQIVRALPRDQLNGFVTRAIKQGLEAIPAAPLASELLSLFWAQGQTQALVESGISMAAAALVDHRAMIKSKVTQKSSRFIPRWVDAIVADKIVSGLAQLLDEMRSPNHPWRMELGTAVEGLIKDLAENPQMIARGEELKAEILGNPVVLEQVGKLWERIETRLDAESESYIDPLSDTLERALIAFGDWIMHDEQIGIAINQWLGIALLRIIAPRRAEIGIFIAQVVERWDSKTLVNRLELQVGRDLQYIRINGTLVGGLVGLIIFTARKWL